MSAPEVELLLRVRAAKLALRTAAGELGVVMANDESAPRAQKRIIGDVAVEAFSKLQAASADLARLEALLAEEEG